ncbi:MAG: hypothetical protein NTY12_05590 [Candidatus Falkowbacteria bacterium]|nr:hypothetical protein [Candidatus Falkowbacteria bacterium]
MKRSISPSLITLLKTKSFQLAIIFLMASTVVVLFAFYITFYKFPEKISRDYVLNTRSGINTELEKLEKHCQEIALVPEVVDGVYKQDISALSGILPWQLNKYGVGIMSAINKDGFTLVRTKTTARTGDNFFLNAPLGRAIASTNDPVASVEVNSGDTSQLMLLTGCDVHKDNKNIGALTANYLADDSFASRFAEKYLNKDVQIVFYTKDSGVYSSSFSNETDRKLFSSYFYPESAWIKNASDNSFVRTAKGDIFLIRNVIFPGLESSPGGALVLIPLNNIFLIGSLGAVLPILLFLFFLFILHRRFSRKEKQNIWCCPFISIFAIFYVFSSLALFTSLYSQYPLLRSGVYQLYNSVLRFQPDGGVFDRRYTQRISAVVDTGNESVNAIRLSISYNPSQIKVQSVDMDRSICGHFILSEHNSEVGKIKMECIIPNPGFTGNNAVVADLFVKALEDTTTTTIKFLSDTEVLANDGLGTSVLRLANDSTLRFENSGNRQQNKELTVFSPSHPNAERWYSNGRVDISWEPRYSGIVTAADNSCVVSPASLPPLHKNVPRDGIYRFIVSAKDASGLDNLGEVTVRVDTTPPDKVELKASETKVKPGGMVRFQASGHDALSGLQRVFYIKVNDEIFFPIGSEIYIPFPQSGKYNVTLRAYDKAGNYKDATQKIIVSRFQ